MTYGQVWWPILRICALQLIHPKCTHTAVNTHTPWTHTRSSGQPFMLRRPGSSCGFGALLKGTSVVVLRVKRALDIHSPHLQFLPARDSNSQPLDYESNSLTIRPRLPYSIKPYRNPSKCKGSPLQEQVVLRQLLHDSFHLLLQLLHPVKQNYVFMMNFHWITYPILHLLLVDHTHLIIIGSAGLRL